MIKIIKELTEELIGLIDAKILEFIEVRVVVYKNTEEDRVKVLTILSIEESKKLRKRLHSAYYTDSLVAVFPGWGNYIEIDLFMDDIEVELASITALIPSHLNK